MVGAELGPLDLDIHRAPQLWVKRRGASSTAKARETVDGCDGRAKVEGAANGYASP